MSEIIKPYDWITLRSTFPPRFHKIIDLCYLIENNFSKINRLGLNFITERRLREITDLAERVMFEYKSLIYPKHDEVKMDLQKEYELLFYGGKDSFLLKYTQADPSRKQDYLQAFILQLHAMIHFRIYDSLTQINIDKEVKNKFMEISLAKTGVFEKIGEEDERGVRL